MDGYDYDSTSGYVHELRERQEGRFAHRNVGDRALYVERLEAGLETLWQAAYKRFRKGS